MEKNENEKMHELVKNGNLKLAMELTKGLSNTDMTNLHNVLGTIGYDLDGPFVECFTQIKEPNDLEIFGGIKLRHRMNSHRRYKCFGLKLSDENFKVLEADFMQDPRKFTDWIISLNLNYFRI